MRLRLDEREVGRPDKAVWPEHGEEVRESGDAHAFVGLHSVIIPEPAQGSAAGPLTGYVSTSRHPWNPVARISTSTSWVSPSAVATPEPVILSIGSVIRSTLSRLNVDRYVLWKPGRLQPTAYRGVSLSRTTGSSTCLRRYALPAFGFSWPSG